MTTGVVDTGNKFTADDIDTGGHLAPVPMTLAANCRPILMTHIEAINVKG